MPRTRSSRRRAVGTMLACLALFAFSGVIAAAAPANAEDATQQQTSSVTDQLQRIQRRLSGGAKTIGSSAMSATSGSQAQGSAAKVVLFGTEVLVIGGTSAQSGNNTSSDANVISLLGNELIGAHSTSSGGSGSNSTGYGQNLCAMSNGSLCLALLYGEANSSASGGTDSSDAYSALAQACVNGGQADPSAECNDGLVTAGLGESRSSSESNSATGVSSSKQSTTVARLCIGDKSDTAECDGIGAVLLERHLDSTASPQADPTGLSLQAGGQELGSPFPHPGTLGDCGSGFCIDFNLGTVNGGTAPAASPVIATDGTSTAHARGVVLQLVVFGTEALRASSTEADTRTGQSSADATVLSVLGHELIGAHAKSSGGSASDETGYLTETCDASNGSLCLALLYGAASSQDSVTSSSGTSDTYLGSACIGGNQEKPTENCDGPIGVTVGESHSTASQDKTTGAAKATQHDTGADICLGGENDAGVCTGLGIVLLDASSQASAAPGQPGSGSGDSSIVTVESGGNTAGSFDQPGTIDVPPGCPAGSSLLCLTLNQVSTTATAGSANAGSTVLNVVGLHQTSGDAADGTASQGAVSASAKGRAQVQGKHIAKKPAVGGLAATGVSVALLLIVSLALLATGVTARRRSRIAA